MTIQSFIMDYAIKQAHTPSEDICFEASALFYVKSVPAPDDPLAKLFPRIAATAMHITCIKGEHVHLNQVYIGSVSSGGALSGERNCTIY